MKKIGARIRNLLARIKGLPFQAVKNPRIQAVITVIVVTIASLGETTTVDTSQMTAMITSLMPLIILLLSMAIPLMFFKYIMRLIEKILGSFS